MTEILENEALTSTDLNTFKLALQYHLTHPKDFDGLFLCIGNSLELAKLDKAKIPEDVNDILEEIGNLIDSALNIVEDATLKSLLKKNKESIQRYLGPNYVRQNPEQQRVLNPQYKLSNCPDFKAIVRKMVKETEQIREPLSDNWKQVAEAINNPKKEQFDVIEDEMAKAVIRVKERDKWGEQFLCKTELARRHPKQTELSWESNPQRYFKEKVLDPLAERLLKELKGL